MELYIAEYLVENGFANDMVSALKILHVASDDWYDELINEDQVELAKIRRKIQELNQRGKPVPPELHAMAAKLAKEVNSAAKIGAELNKGKPKPKGVPGRGETPQSTNIERRTRRSLPNTTTGRRTSQQTELDRRATGRLDRDRRTPQGQEANKVRPTEPSRFYGQPLASQDPGADLTYTMKKPKSGQTVSQALQDYRRAVAPGTESTKKRSTRYSDSSNPPRG